FCAFTAIVSASYATGSSTYSTLFALHWSISDCWIGREASQTSISPFTNFFIPPPVPDLSTLIATPLFNLENSCATACESLKTVLEPSISILPDSAAFVPLLVESLPFDETPPPAPLLPPDGGRGCRSQPPHPNAAAAAIANAKIKPGLKLQRIVSLHKVFAEYATSHPVCRQP